eukprot:TRINITY_DN2813_c0_g1_i1.p1 TRINITY_DN2813_c0_g1~~TRINITY_DN2813_c0_g1_i1.p1  ORF type:complete len:226 (-),score=42.46 TRINITY_DN2813_c0_g1_i1:290-877(-)
MSLASGAVVQRRRIATSGVELHKNDHKKFSDLMNKVISESDPKSKQQLFEEMRTTVSKHLHAEEHTMYPMLKEKGYHEDGLNHHKEMKTELDRLDAMKVNDPKFNEVMKNLLKVTTTHSDEEENQIFPALIKNYGDIVAQGIIGAPILAKIIGPTHGHADAPYQPPLNFVTGPVVSAVDHVKDAVNKVTGGDKKY